jgi:hypothetical protein
MAIKPNHRGSNPNIASVFSCLHGACNNSRLSRYRIISYTQGAFHSEPSSISGTVKTGNQSKLVPVHAGLGKGIGVSCVFVRKKNGVGKEKSDQFERLIKPLLKAGVTIFLVWG